MRKQPHRLALMDAAERSLPRQPEAEKAKRLKDDRRAGEQPKFEFINFFRG
jgi:hypothetical protein